MSGFIEARLRSQSVPTAQEVNIKTGSAFEAGALGFLTNGEFEEAAADPAQGSITHVAQTPAGSNTSGFGAIGGRREFPPGRTVVTDTRFGQQFRADYVGTLPANPGGSYGVVRGTDAKWRVDFSETAKPVVKYLGLVNVLPGSTTPRPVLVEFLLIPDAIA